MDINSKTEKYLNKNFSGVSDYERLKLKKDWFNKKRLADKLVTDFKKRVGDIKNKKILELGFGNGLQLLSFVRQGAIGFGLEVDNLLLEIAKEFFKKSNNFADLRIYDGESFPFKDNSLDYIYATSVLEHVSSLDKILTESFRTLKVGGKFYISYPNRLRPKETHTGIWFLSYLPLVIATFVVGKIFRRSTLKDWNLHFLSYWTLKRVLRKNNIEFKILYETESSNFFKRIIKKMLAAFKIHHSAVLGTVMVILQKK